MAPPPRLAAAPGASAIHQDVPHDLGGEAEELRPVLPLHVGLVHELQVGLVYEGVRLQGVARTLPAEVRGRPPVEVGVDETHQAIPGGFVAAAPGLQEIGHGPRVRGDRGVSPILNQRGDAPVSLLALLFRLLVRRAVWRRS